VTTPTQETVCNPNAKTQESLALASIAQARRPQCAVKWDQNLKPKLAIMRQCTYVTDRRTDRRTLAS